MAELDRNMSEGERRDIVRALANRTARSGEILETTVQPQYDYAAAAQAAMAADPVDIPPEALADLSARTNAPSEAGSLYAEAQRAIFEAGRGREGEYNDDWMNAQQGVVDASQFALDEYMNAIEAARAGSYAYNTTAAYGETEEDPYGGLPVYRPGMGIHPLTGATATEKFQKGNIYRNRDTSLHGPRAFTFPELDPNSEEREAMISLNNPAMVTFSETNLADYNDLKDYARELAMTGVDTEDARTRMRTYLIQDGVPRTAADSIANGVIELSAHEYNAYMAAAWRSTSEVPQFSSRRVPRGRGSVTKEDESPVFSEADMLMKKYGFQ